ncbi:hypothetical protein Tco_1538617 [Tanacetum coccineum]
MINTPYSINLNTPYGSAEGQYAVLILQNTPYCLEEQIRCLDCRDQYVVLSRRVDTSYPTGGYGVSVDLSEQPERLATGSMLDTAYGRRVIRRIGNCFDKHKKLLDSVLLDKLKLDGEFELEEEIIGEELIKRYKAIKEKEDPGVFMLHIRLEGKYNYRSLVDTVSNINMLPYRIYELLERDKVKPKSNKVRMLDHLNAKTMERLLNVLCQVRVTTILVNFMLLDVPFDQDIPSYGFKVRNVHAKSNSDDDEDYCLKRDDSGKPFHGPNRPKYLECEDLIDRALAQQDSLNPFNKICVWKKKAVVLF